MISKRYDHLIRLLLLGETGVGKTCLLCRYASDDFVESHISTIGIDFKMKTIDIGTDTVKVQIWDTAGQERFEAITKQFYRRAQGILMVYDICSRTSFEAIPKWLNHVRQHCEDSVIITMVGNKSDKQDKRQVPFIEAQNFADENNIHFYEVSARNRNNLDKPFHDMCVEVLQVIANESQSQKENTSITIENTSIQNTTPTNDNSTTSDIPLKSEPENQGNWCCSIS